MNVTRIVLVTVVIPRNPALQNYILQTMIRFRSTRQNQHCVYVCVHCVGVYSRIVITRKTSRLGFGFKLVRYLKTQSKFFPLQFRVIATRMYINITTTC